MTESVAVKGIRENPKRAGDSDPEILLLSTKGSRKRVRNL